VRLTAGNWSIRVNKQKGNVTVLALFGFAVFIAAVVGWVMNIIDIVNSDFHNVTGMLVLRIIGVFLAPLGAVLGYF
jgi:hypothetical protein